MSKLLLTDKADESDEEDEQDKPSMAPAEAPKVTRRRFTKGRVNVSTARIARELQGGWTKEGKVGLWPCCH